MSNNYNIVSVDCAKEMVSRTLASLDKSHHINQYNQNEHYCEIVVDHSVGLAFYTNDSCVGWELCSYIHDNVIGKIQPINKNMLTDIKTLLSIVL
ncbi:hypothetical protein VPHD479_0275 [Vibrio phage D479]